MTPFFLLPLALLAAPPQPSSILAEAPPVASTMVVASTAATPKSRTDDQPAASTPADAATPIGDTPLELSDPLVDPAAQPNPGTQPKAGHHYPGDPLEGFNRTMFRIQFGIDKSIYGPVSRGYQHVVPKPARSGLRNFFRNLTEPVVFLNDLLQLKPGRAARTFARFTINTTVGLAGFLDVAASKAVNLPHRNNSFGNTLAYYGVHAGPYLFLPLVGPTTLRDFLGEPVDGAVLPVAVGRPFTETRYRITSAVITGLDQRAEAEPELRALLGGAVDPYATLRSVWLQNRAAEISQLHSHSKASAPAPELEDP
ncbi:MAG TPA: VacJ family lipoprotein, partial [Sphingomicrobium sp.]|nr:VacJ family lipoprotein [Sphingomicrobium sp.]